MDRRHFLSTSLMAVTAPAFAGATAARQSANPGAAPVSRSTADAAAFGEARFRSLLGSRFQFTGDEWRGRLELTDVVARTSDARVEQFTAIFRTHGSARPAPGTYTVHHPEMGRFALRIDGQRESDLRLASFALLRD
jgi:hypothetical protein